MSRIVRGSSSAIREISIMAKPVVDATEYSGPSFRSARMVDQITPEDLQQAVALAKAEGRKEATRDLEQKLSEPIRQAIDHLDQILNEISMFRRELFKEAEAEVVEFSRLLCKRILKSEIRLNPEKLLQVVSKGLELVERQKRIQIIVSSADADLFNSSKAGWSEQYRQVEQLDVIADPRMQKGQALLKTDQLEVDINLEGMIDQMIDHLNQTEAPAGQVNDETETT